MKYIKMTEYQFSTDFTRVFIVSSDESYAEVAGDIIPDGCEEITESEFISAVESVENNAANDEEALNDEKNLNENI